MTAIFFRAAGLLTMKSVHAIVVFLLLLLFGAAFVIPAADSPETAYDESQTQPYTCAPQSAAMSHVAGAARELLRPVMPVNASAQRPLDSLRPIFATPLRVAVAPNLAAQISPIRC